MKSSSGVRRFEPSAIRGVLAREVINYRSFWKSSVVSSIGEPVMYFLAFGFGVGAMISNVGNLSYFEYVATGIVGMTVMFSGAFPAMFGTFVKYKFQHTYDGILAAPVDVEDLVTAEALWLGARVGIYGCLPLVVAMLFGLDPAIGMLLIPFICAISGLGWACFGLFCASVVSAIDNFQYITSLALMPMMMLSGAFFPVSQLPEIVEYLVFLNPLYSTVELVRGAVFGWHGMVDFLHVGILFAWAFIFWRLAIMKLSKRLIG